MIIVQIGTNTGNDHVLDLCKSMDNPQVFLVEPFHIHNKSIHENYKNIATYTVDNVAIVPSHRDSVDLYYTEKDGPSAHPNKSYEVASIRPEHLMKHKYAYTSLRKITVPALTINEYLKSIP